jgi:hypothetical protein
MTVQVKKGQGKEGYVVMNKLGMQVDLSRLLPMELVLAGVMCMESLKNPAKQDEGFTADELSVLLLRSPARVRSILRELKKKGVVTDEFEAAELEAASKVLEEAEERQIEEHGFLDLDSASLESLLAKAIAAPRAGVKKRWRLLIDPEEGLKKIRKLLEERL